MLKGRGRDNRGVTSPTPGHPNMRSSGLVSPSAGHPSMRSPGLVSPTPGLPTMRSPGLASPTSGQTAMRSSGLATRSGQQQRALPAKPEPDYEVVEFPSDQYVNAKLQPPPPPPPRPPTDTPEHCTSSSAHISPLLDIGLSQYAPLSPVFGSSKVPIIGRVLPIIATLGRQVGDSRTQPVAPLTLLPVSGREISMCQFREGYTAISRSSEPRLLLQDVPRHPAQAGASCGLCGGGGAHVRCAECGRRALCASCDDMYHRHPKRRHHQRQALSLSQLGEDRPPLPPKGTPPVPPPRRHKMSASPMPPMTPMLDQRRTTLGHAHGTLPMRASASPTIHHNQVHQPLLVQTKIVNNPSQVGSMPPSQVGSMPYLPTTMPHQQPMHIQQNSNTLGHLNAGWNRPRGSLQGFTVPQLQEPWDSPESIPQAGIVQPQWGRPMRRGASTLELGGPNVACAHCAPPTWRYGSCAALDQPWGQGVTQGGWPVQPCCPPQQPPHGHFQMHQHMPQTPQPYRRADSRAMSRAASRAGSRAASPSLSVRSRASRRTKHRTPSPPLPSSDADSESESDTEPAPKPRNEHKDSHPNTRPERPSSRSGRPISRYEPVEDGSLGPVPSPPAAPWHCEHCTYVNEPGVRVCVICCRTPIAAPKVIEEASNFERLNIASRPASPTPERVGLQRVEQERASFKSKKERTSTGCGPSPPREEHVTKQSTQRLITPTREQNGSKNDRQTRYDTAVGPSPPKETRIHNSMAVGTSPPRETQSIPISKNSSMDRGESIRAFPNTQSKVERHSVSVGPSPSRENLKQESNVTGQKKFVGTSPPRDVRPESRSSTAGKTNVSNTGTSPPPQSISTQTYEDPSSYERAGSAARSRPRRRFRDERRERSHSRHSLSSDTRESDRSVRTSRSGAWEWRERDSSPSAGAGVSGGGRGGGAEWGEWGGKLARRASHLDLRRRGREGAPARRTSLYGSEAASPEPPSGGRAISMEVLSGAGRNAERGLELARLLAEAERLGYSAAEVQVGLAQSPGAPLAWLRSRWAGLAGAVQGAVARLAPGASLTEAEARAALARHRGAVWPAVTECVDMLSRQTGGMRVGAERRVRGRVWGSPAGADDDAAPRARADDSSDEYPFDEWYPSVDASDGYEVDREIDLWSVPPPAPAPLAPLARDSSEVALKLRSLLLQAGIPSIDENLLLKGLLSNGAPKKITPDQDVPYTKPSLDFIQSENDFIDAYNALTRASPLPNISKPNKDSEIETISTESKANEHIIKDDETHQPNSKDTNKIINTTSHHHNEHTYHTSKQNIQDTHQIELNQVITKDIQLLKIETEEAVQQNQILSPINEITHVTSESTAISQAHVNQRNEKATISGPTSSQTTRQAEEKSSNLNDIVDNTQKLIQQMKEEINSDIHSLDDGHSQTSRSEHDTSSHDEQESSYSETDEETNNTSMTSDEKEVSSSSSEDDHDNIELTRNDVAFVNRTSSEDNEQFEEALDNLDNQIEDVKHANIEILDSIARSLQEEHTISIELNEPSKSNINMDDFYNGSEESKDIIEKNLKTNDSHNISMVVNAPNDKTFKREDSNNNIFEEVNSFEEIYEELNTNVSKKPASQENAPNANAKKIVVTESIPIKPKIRLTKYAINKSVFKIVSPTRVMILDNKEPKYNAVIENTDIHYEDSTVESATEVIHEHLDSDSTNQAVKVDTKETSDIEPVTQFNITSSTETVSNNASETAEIVSNSNVDVTITARSSPADQKTIQKLYKTNEQNIGNTKSQNTSVNDHLGQNGVVTKRNTPDKITENQTKDNKNPTGKSNIPKPVRLAPNNKPKNEKSAPKLIVSKVPVRRGSLKQHHAPAPPKTHFGNVQNGHVKQLQSKIFNSKDFKPTKPEVNEIEVKPSTSALPRKSPAPQPPTKSDHKQQSPQKSPPRENRNNYFRETCRTEDEWTESDSDESQIIRQTSVEEAKPAAPSPPPPITLRRVSGNIIDLARVHLPEGSPERQARMLLAEGATETWEQAHLAVELVSRGAELPAALLAALECTDLPAALAYLHQDCELCASRLPEHEMVSMLRCTHRCCRECARLYFTVQITERSIADCVCPFCKMPDLENMTEDAWLEYFAHLDIQLKTLLETDVHELFQRKLRDRTLAMDPNFKWCMECSSGFFVHPKQKKLRCPECRSVTCASCRKSWSSNHEGLSCEQYASWLADNDPEISVAAVQQHLRENGLECPRCHFKYSLSRGGCMHFTCTQCKYEFCYGCGKPFTMGARCGLSEYCAKLGLHAHHPRNCLFYLRDKEPQELQTLLQMNNVTYETEATEGSNGRCPIPLQRETPTGLVDGICGSEAPPKSAGLCKNHYLEYLTRAVRARGADPLPILAVDDLETLVKRAGLRPPPRPYGSLDGFYRRALTEIVKEKIPLD